MSLITRKSDCRDRLNRKRILSQKDAIRRAFSIYTISDILVLRKSDTSYVSSHEIVIDGVSICDDLFIKPASNSYNF